MKNTIAIQGIKGSYHHEVAVQLFGADVNLDECLSFDALVASVTSGQSQAGVMALENSIAGSIIPNYALIDKHQLHIVAEAYIRIEHQLMVLPGTRIEDIAEVASHPMALLQCKDFFATQPHIKLIEDDDTAEVAQRIAEKHISGLGAIASRTAAKLYGLDIVAPNIHSIENNATRFVVVKTTPETTENADKASLKFILDHKRGSLAAVLNVLSDCKLNLTKIQSMPVVETPWKYSFFVDVTFDEVAFYTKAVQLLEIMTESLKVLGTYKNKLA
ncbi:MAG: prephenate dehydratase [Flavobacteriaceae bacterium]